MVTPGAKPPIGYTHADLCGRGRRGDLSVAGLPDLRVVGAVSWGPCPVPLLLTRTTATSPSTADDLAALITRAHKGDHPVFAVEPDRGRTVARRAGRESPGSSASGAGPDVRIYSDEIYEADPLRRAANTRASWRTPGCRNANGGRERALEGLRDDRVAAGVGGAADRPRRLRNLQAASTSTSCPACHRSCRRRGRPRTRIPPRRCEVAHMVREPSGRRRDWIVPALNERSRA